MTQTKTFQPRPQRRTPGERATGEGKVGEEEIGVRDRGGGVNSRGRTRAHRAWPGKRRPTQNAKHLRGRHHNLRLLLVCTTERGWIGADGGPVIPFVRLARLFPYFCFAAPVVVSFPLYRP